MKQGIIFDLDGTLWDSSQAVVDAWNTILEGRYHFTVEQMQAQMGKTMDAIAYSLFADEDKEEALRLMTMCTDYENIYIEKHGGNLYSGVRETLEDFSNDNKAISLLDNWLNENQNYNDCRDVLQSEFCF